MLFPLSSAVLEWDSMISPSRWGQLWAELCLEAVHSRRGWDSHQAGQLCPNVLG